MLKFWVLYSWILWCFFQGETQTVLNLCLFRSRHQFPKLVQIAVLAMSCFCIVMNQKKNTKPSTNLKMRYSKIIHRNFLPLESDLWGCYNLISYIDHYVKSLEPIPPSWNFEKLTSHTSIASLIFRNASRVLAFQGRKMLRCSKV